MRWMATAGLMLGLPVTVAAQGFELGGSISHGCTGDSSGFCGDDTGVMPAIYGALWVSPKVQVLLRVANLPLDDHAYTTHRDERFNLADDAAARTLPRIDITTTARSRRLVSGEILYHFAPDSGLEAVLGAGLGDLSDRGRVACLPAGCERVLVALGSTVGNWASHVNNLTMVAGLSGRIGRRVRMTGGFRLHNFAGESLSTSELFLGAGVLFGKR
jgi:hypothetical protein